jgi:uridylate kinase
MFGSESHEPGQNIPIDLLGARLARDNKISMCIMDGKDPSVMKKIVNGELLGGTLIH